ncbi:hypothetical protein NliqN6_2103 [Naganishia liquefaciens]|uniref:HIT-type domain-containing protein n=1 Tax=Naganishia liquefaciens TaxID=104408 RepID=A0A8H3TRN1_9TREE|nr:hypothetical protein NliqN6_2103 [Naganishia liquefaciens]
MSASPCAICSAPAKYTCPRCAARTCSLPCSRAHKAATACTGERDKAAYVPMNAYGYGTMMSDYVFLEEGKRKVERWGKGIEGIKMGSGSGKCAALRGALAGLGVRVDFLPEGMERRRKNQSHYNPRTHLIQLSIEFKYPSPPPGAQPATTPSHQMQNIPLDEHTSLARIYTHHARRLPTHYPSPPQESSDAETNQAPQGLVFTLPVYDPPSSLDPAPPPPAVLPTPVPRFYSPLHATDPLRCVLRDTSFLEYPSIHVFLVPDWEARVRDGRVAVVPKDGASERVQTAREGLAAGDVADSQGPAKKPRTEEPVEGPVERELRSERTSTAPQAKEVDQPSSITELQRKEASTLDALSTVPPPAGTPGLLSLDYGTESEEGGCTLMT